MYANDYTLIYYALRTMIPNSIHAITGNFSIFEEERSRKAREDGCNFVFYDERMMKGAFDFLCIVAHKNTLSVFCIELAGPIIMILWPLFATIQPAVCKRR
ncbi:unnamed protein product [Mucor hiemalis]